MRAFAILRTRMDNEKCITTHTIVGVYANKEEALKQYNQLVESHIREEKIYWENFNKGVYEEFRVEYEEKEWGERMNFIDRSGDGIEIELLKTDINF